MKAVMLVRAYNEETKERGEVACLEVPKPELVHGDDVLIKVAYASVCGSDPHLFRHPAGMNCPALLKRWDLRRIKKA